MEQPAKYADGHVAKIELWAYGRHVGFIYNDDRPGEDDVYIVRVSGDEMRIGGDAVHRLTIPRKRWAEVSAAWLKVVEFLRETNEMDGELLQVWGLHWKGTKKGLIEEAARCRQFVLEENDGIHSVDAMLSAATENTEDD